ncbi:Myb-like DNA-binding domain protein [Aspergillus sclerotioniger CBS 115572]|uniref:Myb-like DNA-binding domain protein n=1 Tax=Aspergillus sclerotioniger CBS 115572 TaxID=1450535 RepID=A0A317V9J6_9EURO|nr:Myb-like DNA-binding domain protein [Aspergillus sclerotioniger CBS 115572]PWY71073.1 Myb-like DNA-binding domain protein [Aspergillus sclerotioniger CBS 115572]
MERPTKRPRLSIGAEPQGEVDDIDIHEARAQNDLRLKSIFEGIFEKYGKDFTDVGDEIDLQTGKIVVDNGHIEAMDGEDDTGEQSGWLFEPGLSAAPDPEADGVTLGGSAHQPDAETGSDTAGDDGTQSQHPPASIPSQTGLAPDQSRETTASEAANGDPDTNDDRSSADSLLDTALCVQNDPDGSRGRKAMADVTGKPATKKANPAAEASAQSRGVKFSEAVEAIWRVPEISGGFATPAWNKSRPAPSLNLVRSQSPPRTGSTWALPWSSRRSSGSKRAKKPQTTPQGRRCQSSPVGCDWSFAETPDGDESDDPLQEDYEPSPTPKRGIEIRGKRLESHTPTRTKDRCESCQQYFARPDYVSHLKDVLSKPADGQHDQAEVRRHLSAITNPRTPKLQAEGGTTSANTSAKKGAVSSVNTTKAAENIPVDNDTTPTKKRVRTFIGPDEARLIVRMRQVQGKKWNDILDQLPQKSLSQLIQWNRSHWSDRRAKPPPLSKPWTNPEREQLDQIKDQRGLSWATIRAELPGRPLAEIEFELLQRWVGEEVLHKEAGDSMAGSTGKDES